MVTHALPTSTQSKVISWLGYLLDPDSSDPLLCAVCAVSRMLNMRGAADRSVGVGMQGWNAELRMALR